jgi:hypothetical protein
MPVLAVPFEVGAFDGLVAVFGLGGLAVVIERAAFDGLGVVGALDGRANATAPVVPAITAAAAMPPALAARTQLLRKR